MFASYTLASFLTNVGTVVAEFDAAIIIGLALVGAGWALNRLRKVAR